MRNLRMASWQTGVWTLLGMFLAISSISCGWSVAQDGVEEGTWYSPNVPDLVGNANFAPSSIPADWEFPGDMPQFARELPAPSKLRPAINRDAQKDNGSYEWQLVAGRNLLTDDGKFLFSTPSRHNSEWGYAIIDFGRFPHNIRIDQIFAGSPRPEQVIRHGGWVGLADFNADYWKFKSFMINDRSGNYEDEAAVINPVGPDGHIYILVISYGWLDPGLVLGEPES